MASPVKTYRFGNVSLSQFENQNTKDGQSFTTTSFNPQKVYKQGEETKFSNSFKPAELFFLIECCVKATQEYYQKTYAPKQDVSNKPTDDIPI